MKKIMILTTLILAHITIAQASDDRGMNKEPEFARFVNMSTALYFGADEQEWLRCRDEYDLCEKEALKDLSQVSLDSKYKALVGFVEMYAKRPATRFPSEILGRTPESWGGMKLVHSMRVIVESFFTAQGSRPEMVLATLKLVHAHVLPNRLSDKANYSEERLVRYVTQQARNQELSVSLRKEFALFYAQVSKSEDRESFSYKLLSEITRPSEKK